MRQFVKYSRLKQFALRVRKDKLKPLHVRSNETCLMPIFCYLIIMQALASTLNEGELSDLKDQFDAIDVDKNGSISLEEMRQVTH